MLFKKLNEEYTSDDLYQELIDYIYPKLEAVLDNMAMQASNDLEDYDADYASDEPTINTQNGFHALRKAAEYFAEDLLSNAPEVIHEDVNDFYRNEPSEDFDVSAFIGKPLKDFLKTIDHRTKINISSDAGFDPNGGVGNTAGMSGLAHDAGWYLADKLITDIKVPKDKRFYDYSIFIESCEKDNNKKKDKKLLNEKKWQYNLKSGKALRKAISNGNIEDVKKALINSYKEINKVMPDEFDNMELEQVLIDLDYIDTNEESSDEWDFALSDFYDLCDNLNIWIGV